MNFIKFDHAGNILLHFHKKNLMNIFSQNKLIIYLGCFIPTMAACIKDHVR